MKFRFFIFLDGSYEKKTLRESEREDVVNLEIDHFEDVPLHRDHVFLVVNFVEILRIRAHGVTLPLDILGSD